MDATNYYELFGVGEKEQEAADPEMTEETISDEMAKQSKTGEKGQEAAAPVRDNDEQATETSMGEESEGQTSEQNAAFAAARRKAERERDAAIQAAREDAQRQIDEFYKNCGITDPFTGKTVKTKAEYDAYKAREAEEKRNELKETAGMSDEDFRAFVDNLPEVQEARAAKEAAEKAQAEAARERAQAELKAQLEELNRLDGNIHELGDLAHMDNYDKFYALVKKGNTLVDAYKLANFDKLAQREADGARQAAMNSLNGKKHMAATQTRGAGAAPVPQETKEIYRALNPGVTDAEISAHWQRSHKG